MGVSILGKKCEWVTHTLRGSDTPHGGPAGGFVQGGGGRLCPMALWTASDTKGFGPLRTCVYSRYARGGQGAVGGRAWGGGGGLRLPDGGWGGCWRIEIGRAHV